MQAKYLQMTVLSLPFLPCYPFFPFTLLFYRRGTPVLCWLLSIMVDLVSCLLLMSDNSYSFLERTLIPAINKQNKSDVSAQRGISIIEVLILVLCNCLFFQILWISYFSFYLFTLSFISFYLLIFFTTSCLNVWHIFPGPTSFCVFAWSLIHLHSCLFFQFSCFLIVFCSHIYPDVDFLFTIDVGFCL